MPSRESPLSRVMFRLGIFWLPIAVALGAAGCSQSPQSSTATAADSSADSPVDTAEDLVEGQASDSWTLVAGHRDGRPLLARINQGLGSVVGRPEYRTRVTVSVKFRQVDQDGMPSGGESSELDSFEDQLAQLLSESDRTVFAAAVTIDGRRDFLFYSGVPEEAEALARQFATKHPKLQVTVASEADPNWTAFRALSS